MNNPTASPSVLTRLGDVLRMIKFQHTIFALPFALLGALLAAWHMPAPWWQHLWGWPIVLILLACVFARSAAMAFNRLADVKYDAANPRTAQREIPAGVLSRRFVGFFVIFNVTGFVAVAYLLNWTAFILSPVVLLVLLGYSYTKRYTAFCHFVLGMALGMAPAGAWVAVQARLDWPALLLGGGVMLWTAGFDIIYACQDYSFDSEHPELHSIPKRLGLAGALRLSSALHLVAWACFAGMLFVEPLGLAYGAGLAIAATLLIYQHCIISPSDLSRVNAAFFTANGLIAIFLFGAACVDTTFAVFGNG